MGKEYPEGKVRAVLAQWTESCIETKYLPVALLMTSDNLSKPEMGLLLIEGISKETLVGLLEKGLELARERV